MQVYSTIKYPLLRFAFPVSVFASAFLLFWFEPMYAKRLLPLFGGSASVWNVTLFFYQSVVLASYLYVHLTTRHLTAKRQAQVHLILILVALAFLSVDAPGQLPPEAYESPVATLIQVLTTEVGLLLLVVASTSPLIQRWFALLQGGDAKSPYHLYAASNAGSLAGLLIFPFVLEPILPLNLQATSWAVLFVGAVAVTAVVAYRVIMSSSTVAPTTDSQQLAASPTVRGTDRLLWFLLSAVPSALLITVTLHLTTDIAAAPFIWVIPLALYLASYVLTFARRQILKPSWMLELQTWSLIALGVYFFVEDIVWLFGLHIAGLFATCMVCHRRLASIAPKAQHLTDFYLWLAFGGVAGGLFSAIIAPAIFNSVIEYPLLLLAAAFIRPRPLDAKSSKPLTYFALLVLLGGVIFSPNLLDSLGFDVSSSIFGTAYLFGIALLLFAMHKRPVAFGLGICVLFATMVFRPDGAAVYKARSFFGVYTVTEAAAGRAKLLYHGTTVHGAQAIDLADSKEPMTYYNREGPLGQVTQSLAATQPNARVAAIGLGTGALSCLLTESMSVTFIEIDPLIVKIAQDSRHFTFLTVCDPKVNVLIGDGRTLIERSQEKFDLIVVDAFSSDAIPIHLLTTEAIEAYRGKLTSTGVIMLHLSNRFIDLVPVASGIAKHLGVYARVQNYSPSAAALARGAFGSQWVVLSSEDTAITAVAGEQGWQTLTGREGVIWTDNYSDLFGQVLWSRLIWSTDDSLDGEL